MAKGRQRQSGIADRESLRLHESGETEQLLVHAGPLIRSALLSALTGVLALLTAALYLRLSRSAMSTPWMSTGDLTSVYAQAKSDIDFGILGRNTDLAFPAALDQSHFPVTDFIWRLAITGLSYLSDSPIAGVNLFIWFSFGLVAAVAYLWFSYVSSNALVSIALSLVLTLLPWHFARAVGHVYLSNYTSLLALLFVTSWVLQGTFDRNSTRSTPVRHPDIRYAAALVLAAIAGMGGVYYVAFYALLLAPLLGLQLLTTRRVKGTYRSLTLAIVPLLSLGFALLLIRSTRSSTLIEGAPPLRIPEEAQMYGGALFTLLIPDSGPLSPSMNQLIPTSPDIVLDSMTLEGNALVSPLAALAMWVAITLIVVRLVPNLSSKLDQFIGTFKWWPAYLFIGLLFFVTTGMGAVVAEYVSPLIRAWGRLSILLVVVGLTVFAILASQFLRSSSLILRVLSAITLLAGLAVPIADATRGPLPVSTASSTAFGDELATYGRDLDAALPKGCPVVPLPWLDFPESPPIVDMPDYSHFLPYLYADNPRWVYGYYKYAADYPVNLDVFRSSDAPRIVEEARRLGLCAVQLDSLGFADDSLSSALAQEIGEPLVVSTTGRWKLFRIPD